MPYQVAAIPVDDSDPFEALQQDLVVRGLVQLRRERTQRRRGNLDRLGVQPVQRDLDRIRTGLQLRRLTVE